MHIVMAFLGIVVAILVLLNRLAEAGIDLRGLNPFLWRRRRQWQKRIEGNPIFLIEQPLELTGLLGTALIKADGDMSSEEKSHLLSLFQEEFKMNKKEAAELLLSSSYLLGKGDEIKESLEKIIQPSLNNFTEAQAKSAIQLLEKICDTDTVGSNIKSELTEKVKTVFHSHFTTQNSKW